MTEQFTERPKPYIGLSGVVDTEQQQYLTKEFLWQQHQSNGKHDRQLALGVKAVHKTQFLDIENKYGPEWYPVGEEAFQKALRSEVDGLRVAQTYLDVDYVGDPNYRKLFVDRICRRGKEWLNAIQFDMLPWHSDDSLLPFLEQVKEETGLKVLLQAHGESMEQIGPKNSVRKLGEYAHAIDYILFDASHGKGVRMNASALKPFIDEGYTLDELSGVGFGVAGGLNAEIVREVLPQLLNEYPDLSWDAEGQLHPIAQHGARPIDLILASEYLNASSEVL